MPIPDHAPPHAEPSALVRGQLLHLHDPSRDRWLSAPLAEGHGYEPVVAALMLSLVKEGDKVLDVGANVGVHALPLAAKVGPTGRVYAVEPEPDNLALLRRNVADNGHANVVVLPFAASDRAGTVRLYKSDDNQGDHRLFDAGGDRPGVEVKAARLDDLIADAAPLALAKLDVQGAEGLALEGMRGLAERSPGLKVVVELWPWGLQRAGGSARAVVELLAGWGLGAALIDESRAWLVPVTPAGLLAGLPDAEDAHVNVLFARDVAEGPIDVPGWSREESIPAKSSGSAG